MRKSIPMSDWKKHLPVRPARPGSGFAARPRESQGERTLRFLSPLETLFFPCLNPQPQIPYEPKILRGDHPHRPPRRLIGMSFRPDIPWQVALQQSLPPLSQPVSFCNNRIPSVEQISADGACLTLPLSQKSPQSNFLSVSICVHPWPKTTFRDYPRTACEIAAH